MNLRKLCRSVKCRGLAFTCGIVVDTLSRPALQRILSRDSFVRVVAFLRLGYWVNVAKPRSFNEHMLNRKLFRLDKKATIIADKYAVRTHLANLGLGQILNELYCVAGDPDEIVFAKLPDAFVVKATHGSGMTKIVTRKDALTTDMIKRLCARWLAVSYNEAACGTEYHYDSITPRIVIEKLLTNDDGSPVLEYELFCFGGKVEFISVVEKLDGIAINTLYDAEWAKLPFGLYNRTTEAVHPKPCVLEEMVRVAEKLSAGWEFLRVDLYEINHKNVVFGELTYSPGGGMLRFVPRRFDFLYGEKCLLHPEAGATS
jgi:hypothetical protein